MSDPICIDDWFHMATHLGAGGLCKAALYTAVVSSLDWGCGLLPRWASAESVAEQSLRCNSDSSVNEQVEDSDAAQTHKKVKEQQDGGVGATPGTMEAACAHLRDKHIDAPQWTKADQAQCPWWCQEQNNSVVGKHTVKQGSFCNQEISADCHQAEGDDGDGVWEEEEQSEDPAPEVTTAPSEMEIGINRDWLQDGAVQEISHSQVDNEHVEASPQTWIQSEGNDGHQVPHRASDGHSAAPQHGQVPVAHNGGAEAGEELALRLVGFIHQHPVKSSIS